MPGSEVFISSCSRRQLARRRWARVTVRYDLFFVLVAVVLAVVAFIVGRSGI
jgi:intracellular septation protein A